MTSHSIPYPNPTLSRLSGSLSATRIVVFLTAFAMMVMGADKANAQCTVDIIGSGIGSSLCVNPTAQSWITSTYTSSISQPGWTYTWTTSPNGTIINGQGTASVYIHWTSAQTGSCANWVNLLVSNGQGCTYNYGTAHGSNGKCVDLLPGPSPNHSGHGMANQSWACKYYPALNNLEPYAATYPCTGCTYQWGPTGGTVVSGQGTSSVSIQWANPSINNWDNKLDLTVTAPNGCSTNWQTQEGVPQSLWVAVNDGYPVQPILGTTSASTGGCRSRYTSAAYSSIQGYGAYWLPISGGTIVSHRVGIPQGIYGWVPDTIEVIWNTPGTKTITFANYALGMGCGTGTSIQVVVTAGSQTVPHISSPNGTNCFGGLGTYHAQNTTGYALNWTTNGGVIYAGQGTPNVQVIWASVGVHPLYLTSTSGTCTSIDTIFVNVQPVFCDLGPDVAVCSGSYLIQGPPNKALYSWSTGATTQSITVTNSGTYMLETYEIGTYCVAYDTIQVQLSPISGFDLGPNVSQCGGTRVLSAPVGSVSNLWSTGTTGPTITVTQSGTYHVTATDAIGCSIHDSIQILIHPMPAIALGTDSTWCLDTAQIQGPPGFANYTWSNGDTNRLAMVSGSGSLTLVVTDSNGCTASDTQMVTVHPAPLFSLGNDTTTCGSTHPLSGPLGTFSYLWSDGTVLATNAAGNSGNYWLRVTDADGCSSSDTIQISLFTPPIVDLGLDTVGCDSLTLGTSDPSLQYLWSNGQTSSQAVAITSGTYWVEVMDSNGCMARDTILVTLGQAQATIQPPGPHHFCSGQQITLTGPSGYASYFWNGLQGTDTMTTGQGGPVLLTVTDSLGCSDSDSTWIDLDSLPNAGITAVADTLFASPTGSYVWFMNGLPTGQTGPWIVPLGPGNYTVQVTDSNGCMALSSPYTVLVGVENGSVEGIRIHPNPNGGQFFVEIPEAWKDSDLQLQFLDASGRQVQLIARRDGNQWSVDCREIAAGIYLLRIVGDEVQAASRIEVRH